MRDGRFGLNDVSLGGMAGRFRYLNVGLGVILGFVGIKMLIAEWYHLPVWASLAVIGVVLTVSIVMSIRADRRLEGGGSVHEAPRPDEAHPSHDLEASDPGDGTGGGIAAYLDIDQESPALS